MKKVLITGNSSGLGLAFTQALLDEGAQVFGCSRRGCPLEHPNLHDARLDFADVDSVASGLLGLLNGETAVDLVILNAGILGDIKRMHELGQDELDNLMNINVWANKAAMDALFQSGVEVDQLVLISSGAAVNGNKGWGAYSLSKATLNMLGKLYAVEFTDTHFISLAPGLVDTAMQDHLCDPAKVDGGEFPSVEKLRAARGTENMPTPAVAARNILGLLPRLQAEYDSGAFVDVRTL